MSFIYGAFNSQKQPIDPENLKSQKSVYQNDLTVYNDSLDGCQFTLGYSLLSNQPNKIAQNIPMKDADNGNCITSVSRLHNKSALINKLGLSVSNYPDNLLILKSYQKWGESCMEHFIGDFFFVLWDEANQRLFIARDHIGIEPAYYFFDGKTFVFASTLPGVLAHQAVQKKIHIPWLAHLLTNAQIENAITLYENVFSCRPAHCYTIDRHGLRVHQYFEFDGESTIEFNNDEEYTEAFLEHFNRAVKDRCPEEDYIGAELSGGLDSGSIIVTANRLLRQQQREITTFSHVMKNEDIGKIAPFFDEREAMGWIIEQEKLQNTHFMTLEGVNPMAVRKETVLRSGQPPVGGHFSVNSIPTYKLASECNIDTMLSGHGGDEIVSAYGGGYSLELLQKGQVFSYLKALMDKAIVKEKKVLPWVAGQILRDTFPRLFWYIQDKRHKERDLMDFEGLIKPDIRKQMAIDDILSTHNSWRKMDPTVRERLMRRTKSQHLNSRAERTAVIAKHYGITYQYPMLDIRLLQFCLSLPSHMIVRKGWGRYMLRLSMKDILPEPLRWQVEKPRTSIMPSINRMMRDFYQNKEMERIKIEDYNYYKQFFEIDQLKAPNPDPVIKKNKAQINDAIYWLEACKQVMGSPSE